jgi:pimeloyl-ACP methyl ester carboxylesterase
MAPRPTVLLPEVPDDWLTEGQAGTNSPGQPPQTAQSPKQGSVILIGGAGDGDKIGDDGIVSAYAKPFSEQNPNLDVRYFPHDQGQQVQDYVKSLPPGTDVSIVGHSWGGDTAAQVTQSLGAQNIPVNTLVTIDPVGHGWNDGFMSNVATNTANWVNVQADPSSPDFSDAVAFWGNRVGTDAKPCVDNFIVSPNNHEDFGTMMDTTPPGTLSPKDAVVGGIPAP